MNRITKQNALFWDELCGTQLAKSIGVVDNSPQSLYKFDTWYFDFYPYLDRYIKFSQQKEKNILEVGLGYGTVAQKLAEAGAHYTGLDIAAGPVTMVNHRLKQVGAPGAAIKGSILEPNLKTSSFDTIIAIGSLHHTGNLALAIQNCYTLLRPGGELIFMVYNAYSYRRFIRATLTTLRYGLKEITGLRGVAEHIKKNDRAAYDTNSSGSAAPHTDFISRHSLQKLCTQFSSFKAQLENIDQELLFRSKPRSELLKTSWPKLLGLDIYVNTVK